MTQPEEKHGHVVLCALIDQDVARRTSTLLSLATQKGYTHIHLLIQSPGGDVSSGIFLYGLLRNLPIHLTTYNIGQVSSIGVIAYLAGTKRIASPHASFMLHKSHNSPQFATAERMADIAKTLGMDDARTEQILKERASLSDALLGEIDRHDVYLSSEEALDAGIVTEMGDFHVPSGFQLHSIWNQQP